MEDKTRDGADNNIIPSSSGDMTSSLSDNSSSSPRIPKTTPHASLSLTNHTSPIQASPASLESADTARSLLRGVHNESEMERESGSGSKRNIFKFRGNLGSREVKKSNNKQYAKMGLLMDRPTKETTPTTREATPPHLQRLGATAERRGSETIGIQFKEVGVESGEGGVQASPPISVQNAELLRSEGPTSSSPDSGYGNTPDNPGGEEDNFRRPSGHSSSGGRQDELDVAVRRNRSGASGLRDAATTTSANGLRDASATTSTRGLRDSACSVHSMKETDPPPTNHMLHHIMPEANCKEGQYQTTPPGASHDTRPVSSSSALTFNSSELEKQLEDRSYNHVHPSPPSSSSSSLYDTSQVRHASTIGPHTKRHRFRTTSGKHNFSKSTEVFRYRKSLPSQSPPRDEKDYFQVTDELALENSHFTLSEALLSVIEQYKASSWEEQQVAPPPLLEEGGEEESTDVISSTPVSTTPSSYFPSPPSPFSSLPGSSSSYLSSWGSVSSIATNDDSLERRSLSRVSLLELMHSQSCDRSAESTARNLLQHMAGHMTTNIGNMSQLALKLPTDFVLSLQRDEDLKKSVTTSSAHMRGSKEWAPPRKQIIYHIKQPAKNIQVELVTQGHRCTGCGMKVDSSHSRHFRFCNYVGKYFCHNCHTNATHMIPAHILERWSFKKLPVSNFARDLLTKIHSEPVFSVNPAQHTVFNKVSVMAQAKEVRSQLVSIRQYLRTCRRSNKLNIAFDEVSPWTTDLSSFSLTDFVELKSGAKLKRLKSLLVEAISHVKTCPLCQGRGFVCELCNNSDDIIFPFEGTKVNTCPDCRCCFHKECIRTTLECPRCLRIRERQNQRVRKIYSEAECDEMEEPPG